MLRARTRAWRRLASGPGRFLREKRPGTICLIISPEKWGYRISPDSIRILNRILPVTRLHIHVFYPCTLVYTCNSNLVPNTLAVYFISTYTKDFTVILRSFSRMRELIAPGRFSSLGPRLGEGQSLQHQRYNYTNLKCVYTYQQQSCIYNIILSFSPI